MGNTEKAMFKQVRFTINLPAHAAAVDCKGTWARKEKEKKGAGGCSEMKAEAARRLANAKDRRTPSSRTSARVVRGALRGV